MQRTSIFAALALVALSVASPAEAQRRGRAHKIDGVRIDVHLDVGWYSSFGSGFRIDIPIVPDGFIDGVEDEFALSPGAELFFYSFGDDYCHRHNGETHCHDGVDGGVSFWPLLAAQWNFYLNDKWSVFPEAGIAFILWDDGAYYGYHDRRRLGVAPLVGFGARYHFGDRLALLMRVSWPVGFQIGLNF